MCFHDIFKAVTGCGNKKRNFDLTNFHEVFQQSNCFDGKNKYLTLWHFSFLFRLNSSNFGLGWQKRRTLKAKKISSNCGGVTSSNLSSPFTAVHLQIFSWTFVCQGPFITALQLLNWLAIHQDYYIQVNTVLIWLVQKLSAESFSEFIPSLQVNY